MSKNNKETIFRLVQIFHLFIFCLFVHLFNVISFLRVSGSSNTAVESSIK